MELFETCFENWMERDIKTQAYWIRNDSQLVNWIDVIMNSGLHSSDNHTEEKKKSNIQACIEHFVSFCNIKYIVLEWKKNPRLSEEFQKSNIKILERGKICIPNKQIYDCSPFSLKGISNKIWAGLCVMGLNLPS